jgi:hypothetical protein
LRILPLVLDLFDQYISLHYALVILLADDIGEKRKVESYGKFWK